MFPSFGTSLGPRKCSGIQILAGLRFPDRSSGSLSFFPLSSPSNNAPSCSTRTNSFLSLNPLEQCSTDFSPTDYPTNSFLHRLFRGLVQTLSSGLQLSAKECSVNYSFHPIFPAYQEPQYIPKRAPSFLPSTLNLPSFTRSRKPFLDREAQPIAFISLPAHPSRKIITQETV